MDVFIGMIGMFGFSFNPRGWAFCNGQLLPISQYSALFSLLGTQFGGDGRTSFALPDLRGRVPLHFGQGPGQPAYSVGMAGGISENTLTATQLPTHTHTATATSQLFAESAAPGSANPNGRLIASSDIFVDSGPTPNKQLSDESVTTTVTVDNAGSSAPVNNMQPFLAVNYCIALDGIFPTRN